MISAMLAAVLASAVGAVPAPAVGSVASVVTAGGASPARTVDPGDDPAVRVTLNSQNVFDVGDHARVRVHVRDDSYLIVLYADPTGSVRMLYPTNPGDDDFVRSNADVAVQGTGMDASFIVGSTRGTGTVYAAVSKDPFHFDAFRNGAQWSLAALPDTAHNINAEAVLTDVVQRMATAGGRFDYDLVTYSVTPHHVHDNTYAEAQPDGGGYPSPDGGSYGPYPYGGYYGPSYGFAPWAYNPWFYSPWYYGAGFGFSVGFGFGFGGCYGCYPAYYGYAPVAYTGFVPIAPFPHRPFVAPVVVGYRPRATLFASHTLVPARYGGVGYAAHAGFAARPAVFASAHLTTAPGGIGRSALYHSPAAPTVFRQARSTGPAFTPGMGRVVTGADLAHAYRATPVGPAEHLSAGRPMGANSMAARPPMGTRVGPPAGEMMGRPSGPMTARPSEPMMRGQSPAEPNRAPSARAYRVEPQERSGGEGYEAPRGGGGYEAPHGGGGGEAPHGGEGGGGSRAPRSGGGGWGGGGRSGGGGGHAHMTSFGGGHFGGGHMGGGHMGGGHAGGGGHGGGHR